ncbi:MAG: ABC transporter permease [Chitinophagaceae bacterium]
MFKNYLKTAWRSLLKNRLVSFINIFGLGLSMSVGMMIMIRLQDQFSYDRFHPHPERTFRITSSYHKKNGEQLNMASTPLPLNGTLASETNIIESAVSIYPAFNGMATGAGKEIYLNGAFTESSFFNVFGFSLMSGNAATVLQMPNTIVISKTIAEVFFGNNDPVGKVISMENGTDFKITGVLNEVPGKSHISFDAFASYASVQQMESDKFLPHKSGDWYAFNAAYTYVVLKKELGSAALTQPLKSIAIGLNNKNKDGSAAFYVQSINNITPGWRSLDNEIGNGSSWAKLYFEMGIALLILLAACFNYTNLTIARALTRAKEVGLRKIVGAKRHQLFAQYIVESVLFSFCALAFAWLILSFIVRYAPFNDDYEFIPSSFKYNRVLFSWSLGFAVLTGLMAGIAPAWILSAFKPLRVLKNLSTARVLGKVSLQKLLIVFQYSLSLVMIIFLFVFYRQFSLMAISNPGFKKDQVMVLPLNGLNASIMSQQISGISGVKSVSAMSSDFRKHFTGVSAPVWLQDRQEAKNINYYYADESFIPSLQFPVLAGKNFPAGSASTNEQFIILNEQAAAVLGLKDYEKAIGRKLWINDTTGLEIIGIVKDFNYENAGKPIRPLCFRNKKNAYNYLFVSTDNTGKKELESRVKATWQDMATSAPFSVKWLDEEFKKNNSQTATISMLGFLAFMAVSIASLGLLGLVVYTVEVRRKEISIRKIIGANKNQVIRMLSQSFIKLLFVAGLIAMPIGYIFGSLFLQNFVDRTSFGAGSVLLCFLFLLVIGLVTIISQTYKAAIANPVKALRSE